MFQTGEGIGQSHFRKITLAAKQRFTFKGDSKCGIRWQPEAKHKARFRIKYKIFWYSFPLEWGTPPWNLSFKKWQESLSLRSFLTSVLSAHRTQLDMVLICSSLSARRGQDHAGQTPKHLAKGLLPNPCSRIPTVPSHVSKSGRGHLCSHMEMSISGVSLPYGHQPHSGSLLYCTETSTLN